MSVPRVHFPRLQQPKAHEYVAEQIRRHIALRLIAPGESLPSERRLAAMFGVGRPTVQLALKELAADRLVATRRGRRGGTFVSEPAEDPVVLDELVSRTLARREELEELLDYRQAVEPLISRHAAESRKQVILWHRIHRVMVAGKSAKCECSRGELSGGRRFAD